jgi:hypothetical protein
MVVYPANEHTLREARAWAVQTMMFAANVSDNGNFTVASGNEYIARVQGEAQSSEQELWMRSEKQLLAYLRLVFDWCEKRRAIPA